MPFPALLEGAADHGDSGRWSYLAADPIERVTVRSGDWPSIRDRIRRLVVQPRRGQELPPFAGGWIGWLGYELGAAFDNQPIAPRDHFADSDGELHLHDWVIAWDHLAGTACLVSTGIAADGGQSTERAAARAAGVLELLDASPAGSLPPAPPAPEANGEVACGFTGLTYQRAVTHVITAIGAGEIFQANLSQRFVVTSDEDPLAIYRRLRRLAPASHAALLEFGDRSVISASPERFLHYDSSSRGIESRPIKGTRPRGKSAMSDAALITELESSPKDRAENLMIVDLVRNDLHRVAEPESVVVTDLCRLVTLQTVHHLVSTVAARLRLGLDALDLIAATFPAGSITGAPKLRAMAILADIEPVARGVYCGAIGWIGLNGSVGLSVAIRTMVQQRGRVAVHAGGGVTLLSDPVAELAESIDKARAPLAALGRLV